MADKIRNGEFSCPACTKNISIFDVYEVDTQICEFRHGGADCKACINGDESQFKYDGNVEHTHEVQVSKNQKQLKKGVRSCHLKSRIKKQNNPCKRSCTTPKTPHKTKNTPLF